MNRFKWMMLGFLLTLATSASALFVGGELKTALLEKLSSDPSGTEAQIYYNTTEKKAKLYNGSDWGSLGSGSGGGGATNFFDNPNAETAVDRVSTDGIGDFQSSGSGMAASRVTTGLPLQDAPGIESGVKITMSSGLTNYIYTRFKNPPGALNMRQAYKHVQLTGGGYETGDIRVELYSYSDAYSSDEKRVPLDTDGTVGYTELPSYAGNWGFTYDVDGREYYEIRYVNYVSGATTGTLTLNNVTFTPDSSAVVGGFNGIWKEYSQANGDFTITGTNWTTAYSNFVPKKLKDGWIVDFQIRGSTSATASNISLSMPISFGETNLALYARAQEAGVADRSITFARVSGAGSIQVAVGGVADEWSVSGTVKLLSKPTWADFDPTDAYYQGSEIKSPAKAGFIQAYAGAVAPRGWQIADGSAISRATYSDLFANIGTNFGTGDGSTTFNLPDLRGQFLRGVDDGAGVDPDAGSRTASGTGGNTGDNVGSKQADAFKAHNHTIPKHSAAGAGSYNTSSAGLTGYNNTGTTGGNETRPTNINVTYIVKLFNDSGASVSGFKHATAEQSGLVKGGTVPGIVDGSTIASGYLGETLEVERTSPGGLSTASTADVTTALVLTPGKWELTSHIRLTGTATVSTVIAGINTTSATIPAANDRGLGIKIDQDLGAADFLSPLVSKVVNITSTTSYYLSVNATFPSGTCSVVGKLTAKRL